MPNDCPADRRPGTARGFSPAGYVLVAIGGGTGRDRIGRLVFPDDVELPASGIGADSFWNLERCIGFVLLVERRTRDFGLLERRKA